MEKNFTPDDKLALVHPVVRNYVLASLQPTSEYDLEEAQVEQDAADQDALKRASEKRQHKLARRRQAWTGGYVHVATA